MIRICLIALTALIALGLAAAAQETAPQTTPQVASLEDGMPKLRAHVTVTGELVRIGDLIDNAGGVAEVPVFRAPDLGLTGTVSADAVLAAVRAHALTAVSTGGLSEVEVTRASRPITARQIEEVLAEALAAQYGLGEARDLTLQLDRSLRTMHVSPSARGEPRVSQLTYDTHNGRFNAALEIPTGATARRPLRVTGRAIATVEVATVVQTVARGEVLKEADILMERRPRTEVGRDIVTDRAQIMGKAARVSLQPGRPLRLSQLMRPELVQRNEQVTLVYQMPGIMLTVRGKATEGGAEGDVIGVLNEQSKRTLQGVVAGPGRVIVSSGSPRLAANLATKRATEGAAR